MLDTVNALVPVFMVILTGVLLHVSGLIGTDHWRGIENLTYYVLFPATIIMTMATADLSALPVLSIGGALAGGVLAMTVLLLILRPVLEKAAIVDGPAFTSLFQGSARWNSFVAISIAGSLFGAKGVAVTAIAIAAMVPLLNTLSMTLLARYARGGTVSARRQVQLLVSNPFIWSTCIGILIAVFRIPLPKFLMVYGDIVGKGANVTGLLLVGAGLDLSRLMRPRAATWMAIALKLALMPLIVFTLARTFGVSGLQLTVTMLCASVPTASGSYVLAKQNGGDHELMAEILTIQTLFAIATMPLVILAVG